MPEYARLLLTHSRALAIASHPMSQGRSVVGGQRMQPTLYATPKQRGLCLRVMMGVLVSTVGRTSCFNPLRLPFQTVVKRAAKRLKHCVQSHMVRFLWFVLRVSRAVSQKRRDLLASWKSKLLPSAQTEVILIRLCSVFRETVLTAPIRPGATARAGKQNRAIR